MVCFDDCGVKVACGEVFGKMPICIADVVEAGDDAVVVAGVFVLFVAVFAEEAHAVFGEFFDAVVDEWDV